MRYIDKLKKSCIEAIHNCKNHYDALRYILDKGYVNEDIFIFHNDKMCLFTEIIEEIYEYIINVAKKFIIDHPTNCISDFLVEKDFESVYEEAQQITSKLDYYLSKFHNVDLFTTKTTYELTDISQYVYAPYQPIYRTPSPSTSSSSISVPTVNVNITSTQIQAKTRKLKAKWSIEPQKDLMKRYTKYKPQKKNYSKVTI